MGTSRPFYLADFANFILEQRPNSCLDIVVGFGKNGSIIREYTDIWNGNYTKDNWKTKIFGIEIFEEYITESSRFIYDDIFVMDAYDFLKMQKEKIDLIVATDVVEHFERPRAIEMMQMIKEKSNNFFVTMPKNVGNRGGHASKGVGFNKYEAHISGDWTIEQLSEFGTVKDYNNWIWCVHS